MAAVGVPIKGTKRQKSTSGEASLSRPGPKHPSIACITHLSWDLTDRAGPNGRKPYIPGRDPCNHQRSMQAQRGIEDGLPGAGACSVLLLQAGRLVALE